MSKLEVPQNFLIKGEKQNVNFEGFQTISQHVDNTIDSLCNSDRHLYSPHYPYIDKYLSLRYPMQKDEIHEFLSQNKIGRVYALKCLGNWQKKRLMRDLDIITVMNGSMYRTKVDRTVDPSRHCNMVVRSMNINLEKVPYKNPRKTIALGEIHLNAEEREEIRTSLEKKGFKREISTGWQTFEMDDYDIEELKLKSDVLIAKKDKIKIEVRRRVESKINKFKSCQGIIEPYNGVIEGVKSYKDILVNYKNNVDKKYQKVHISQPKQIKSLVVKKELSSKPTLKLIAKKHMFLMQEMKNLRSKANVCPEGFIAVEKPAYFKNKEIENEFQLDNYYRHLENMSNLDVEGLGDTLVTSLKCHVHLSNRIKAGVVTLKKDSDQFIREKIGEEKFKKFKKLRSKKENKKKRGKTKPSAGIEKLRRLNIKNEELSLSIKACSFSKVTKQEKHRLRKSYMRLLMGSDKDSRWERTYSQEYSEVYDKMLELRNNLRLLHNFKEVASGKMLENYSIFEEDEDSSFKKMSENFEKLKNVRLKDKVMKAISVLEGEMKVMEEEFAQQKGSNSKKIDTRTNQQKSDERYMGEVAAWEREVRFRGIEEKMSRLKESIGLIHKFKYSPSLIKPERKITKNEAKAMRREKAIKEERDLQMTLIREREERIERLRKAEEDKIKNRIAASKEFYRKRGCSGEEDWISKGKPGILEEFKEAPTRRSLEDIME